MQRVLTYLSRGLLAVFLLVSSVLAQTEDTGIDYDQWSRLAERAERVIDVARASTPALEDLRGQLVTFRTRFTEAQSENAARITSLEDQLAVLGPAPEAAVEEVVADETGTADETAADPPVDAPVVETVEEPDEIAERRAELTTQLANARAPGLRAQEAFRRANGLIGEIDTIIRDRQTRALLERGTSPVLPAAWGETFNALQRSTGSIIAETTRLTGAPTGIFSGNQGWFETVLFLILAGVVVIRGRAWVTQLTGWVARQDLRGQPIATLMASLGEILVPYLGVLALVTALTATGLLGVRGSFLLDLMPAFALTVFIARWLGGQVFSARTPLFALTTSALREGRLYSSLSGVVLGLDIVLSRFGAFESYSATSLAVLEAILILCGGLLLLRLGMILVRHARQPHESDASVDEDTPVEAGFQNSVILFLGQASLGVAVIGPAAALIGYGALAAFVVLPMITSLGLVGLLMILNRLTREIYGAIRNVSPEAVRNALWPVLVDAVLWLASLPVFALIWGARVSELTELWTTFLAGISVGGAQISPANFLIFAFVFAGLYAGTRLVQTALRTTILPRTRIETGGQVALVSGLGYVGIFLAAVVAITAAGIDLSNLALVAGALSIGIGFGLQTIVSNFVAGIILLIERPVAEGDWIEVNGTMGIVRDISVRSTRIETFDRTDVIVPNADLISGVVTNWTRGNLTGRIIVPVGVAYGNDTKRIEGILREIVEAHPLVILKPAPAVYFSGFGADSLDFEIRAILRDINFMLKVKSELNHAIAERFTAEGIEIPFAQRDLWLRNPEVLAPPKPETP